MKRLLIHMIYSAYESAMMVGIRNFSQIHALGLTLPEVWPPSENAEFPEYQFPYGRIFITGLPSGQLEIWLMVEEVVEFGKSNVRRGPKIFTPKIDASETKKLALTFHISNDKIDGISIGDEEIYPNGKSSQSVIKLKQPRGKAAPPITFEEENLRALKLRRDRLAGFQSNKFKNHPGIAHDFHALGDEARQIQDLGNLILSKCEWHVAGLLSRIRVLLYERDGMGLLQLCAAHLDQSLTFNYVEDEQAKKLAKSGGAGIMFAPIATADPIASEAGAPIDIDVWLTRIGLVAGGKIYSNIDVIRDLGNGFGAHRRPESNELTRQLLGRRQLFGRGEVIGAEFNAATTVSLRLGHLILQLIKPLGEEFERRYPPSQTK